MRGTQLYATLDDLWKRIIPADAGNTVVVSDDMRRYGDHPRGCGEHSTIRRHLLFLWGSSPRMRGTLFSTASIRAYRRIIPADAGNTDD